MARLHGRWHTEGGRAEQKSNRGSLACGSGGQCWRIRDGERPADSLAADRALVRSLAAGKLLQMHIRQSRLIDVRYVTRYVYS